jgi:hypothetical protein
MNPNLEAAVRFAGSVPGAILMVLGQTLVLACVCSDLVRVLAVPRSRRRYLANTVFRTLALPAILIMAFSVLVDAASGTWERVGAQVFALVVVIFRWHYNADEDDWWKGKGKKLARWVGKQLALRPAAAPATG